MFGPLLSFANNLVQGSSTYDASIEYFVSVIFLSFFFLHLLLSLFIFFVSFLLFPFYLNLSFLHPLSRPSLLCPCPKEYGLFWSPVPSACIRHSLCLSHQVLFFAWWLVLHFHAFVEFGVDRDGPSAHATHLSHSFPVHLIHLLYLLLLLLLFIPLYYFYLFNLPIFLWPLFNYLPLSFVSTFLLPASLRSRPSNGKWPFSFISFHPHLLTLFLSFFLSFSLSPSFLFLAINIYIYIYIYLCLRLLYP